MNTYNTEDVPNDDRRERIATAALIGVLSGIHANQSLLMEIHRQNKHDDALVWPAFAKDALRAADALIAELDKQP